MIVFEKKLPQKTLLNLSLNNPYYVDSHYFIVEDTNMSPLDVYCKMVSFAPKWSNSLLSIRNKVVRILGLEDVGEFGNFGDKNISDFTIGDRIDLFYIREMNEHEIVVGLNDKHLDVAISISLKPEALQTVVCISTAIHVHNIFGKVYMGLVTPFHAPIIHSMIRNAYLN
jgi:hypothetical protein|tara:strand:+ start:7330 stop:7839 length:510 start_codon:yes stop_codon:yes gene_type:complete